MSLDSQSPNNPTTLPFEITSLESAGSANDSIDAEIFPFFEEEAREELREVEAELHLLAEQTGETIRVLTDMRRQFHTLKGSANSVGHYRIGAIAHAMKVQTERALKAGVPGCPREFSKLILEVIVLIQNLLLEVRDPAHSRVPAEHVLRVAELIRNYHVQPRRSARLHLR